MLTEEQKQKLNANMPKEWVSTREGGGGKTLSYVQGWVIIDELNAILGSGGWSYDCTATEAHRTPGVDRYNKPQWQVTYTCKCVLTVGDCEIGDYGVGQGKDKDLGAAIESALKEAATDALKRCAKSLGRRMGLALYDKEHEFVGEPPPEVESTPAPTTPTTPDRGHDPSFTDKERARFNAELGRLGLEYTFVADELIPWLKTQGKSQGKRPSQMSQKARDSLLALLGTDQGKALIEACLEAKREPTNA